MDFKKLLELLEKGESITSPLSGIIGGASGILNMLGLGRKKQMRQQKEMVENACRTKTVHSWTEKHATSVIYIFGVVYKLLRSAINAANCIAASVDEFR